MSLDVTNIECDGLYYTNIYDYTKINKCHQKSITLKILQSYFFLFKNIRVFENIFILCKIKTGTKL